MRELEARMAESEGHVPADLAERYDRVSTEFSHGGGFERDAEVARVLAGLGFSQADFEAPLASFSGGWLMRVELAKLFLARPDVLLLDEPTNHLDLPAIEWFEEAIADLPGAIIVVSHDRSFLRKHANRIIDFDGLGGAEVDEAGFERHLQLRAERLEQLRARKANQDREIAQMERFVERFRAKSTKAKQAQSRVKALERIERIELPEQNDRVMRMRIPEPPRSGERVIELAGVSKAYDDNVVYEGLDLSVQRGERLALVGPNGAGKSTLLRMVAGALEPDSGERILGHNVEVGFFAQHQLESLHLDASVLDEVGRSATLDDGARLRGHLGAFLFSGDDVDKKIGVLSGGEKARVALAKMLLRPSNLLVLDEPTNHLDLKSREVLEQALDEYAGTLVFVSHDRSFINTLATRVLEVLPGHVESHLGNYDEYLARKAARGTSRDATPPAGPATTPARAGRARADGAATSSAGDAAAVDQAAKQSKRRAKGLPKGLSKEERQRARERSKARDRAQRRIQKLEEAIQTEEDRLEAIGYRLADPEVYSNAERLLEVQAEEQAIKTAVEDLYRDWERLSDELAALEDAPV
jgi:ATP-binding cassette subfamily F protein 3